MTKKDYEFIAETLRDIENELVRADYVLVCEKLARNFEKENSRFNKKTFLKACNT